MNRTIEMVIKIDGRTVERMPMNNGFDISMASFRAFDLQSPKEKARSLRDIGITGIRADAQYITLIGGGHDDQQ